MISPAKKRIRYRSGSNFNAEYTRPFDWVMASDRGKQSAYCKVCSKHFSVSDSLTAGLTTSLDMGKQILKKITRIFRALSCNFFFQKLNMSAHGNKTFRPQDVSPLVVSPLVVSPLFSTLVVSPPYPSRFAPNTISSLVVSPPFFLKYLFVIYS